MSGKDNTNRKKICIACGGSAGHIFPGLTLAEELKRRYGNKVEVLFITSDNKLARSIFTESGFSFYTIPPRCKRFAFTSNLFKGALKSMKIISSTLPDCFIGFGSYTAGPPFVAASVLRIPTLIHEQNAVIGKANRLMRHFATKITLSFPESLKSKRGNIVVTGNPIRKTAARVQDKTSARDFLGISHNKFTILAIGGSQGSQTINSAVLKMFKDMGRELRDRMQVVHISGEKDYERVKREYQTLDILYKLYPFFNEMGIIYSAADISISRAGASVIFELCAHKIPSILIPYPFAESHQVQNASFFAKRGAVIMIEENGLSGTSLRSAVVKLMEDKNLGESMSEKFERLANTDAAGKLADEVGSMVGLGK
jgi:UDP-N-acetylglucosamine--N-acetylmuramyl-(pentapeptide) pyrophosphoryl-undecaprenol N-acetylglucosamine transferase